MESDNQGSDDQGVVGAAGQSALAKRLTVGEHQKSASIHSVFPADTALLANFLRLRWYSEKQLHPTVTHLKLVMGRRTIRMSGEFKVEKGMHRR